jgi:aminopeptidase
VLELYRTISVDGLLEILLDDGSDEQIAHISPLQLHEIDTIDALATIWSETNTRSLSRVDPGRHARFLSAQRRLANRRWERISAGELAWCGMLFPTNGHAQDADMSLPRYEDFVYSACHVDEDDPAAHWRLVAASLRAQADELESVRELRIVGPDTDLVVGVDGRKWIAADGRYNMPDGEVFTSPVETETQGTIRYTFPAIYHGREVEDVRLRFEEGRVVAAEAARGDDYLRSLLDMDEGARVLGEVAFGLNYEIDRFTRNILFDEKIGGTMHLALGSAFPQAGGSNTSGLHWDMICDLRADGEVYADGELIWKAGRFLGNTEGAPEPVEAAELG